MGRITAALRAARDERTRWPALDGIRGVAIVAVVAYHAFKIMGGWTSGKVRADGLDWWWWPLGAGRLGVDVFFVLSGFLLWFSWERTRERQGPLHHDLRKYAWGRSVRILPPYYVMLSVYIPLVAPELLESAAGMWDVFLFLTVQQFNEPALPGKVNVALWTQTVEVQFYVLFPVLAVLVRRLRPWIPLAGALALALWWTDNRGVYPDSFLFGRLVQFTAGMALAAVVAQHVRGRRHRLATLVKQRAVVVALVAGGAAIALYHGQLVGLPHRTGPELDRFVHPAMALVVAGVLAHVALIERPGPALRAFESSTLRLMGHLSYGVYLWHFPIYDRVLDWTGGTGEGLASWGALGGVTLATVMTLVAAILSYTYIERPFLDRKSRSSISPASAPSPGTS